MYKWTLIKYWKKVIMCIIKKKEKLRVLKKNLKKVKNVLMFHIVINSKSNLKTNMLNLKKGRVSY